MENYDNRQQDGGNFGEAREDVFADPFDSEAVSQDAGQGDWGGGLLEWDLPQEEEQQEQGFVEGEYDLGSEYDPGFVPEGEYAPGSEYDPEGGYDPLFTWGGFEDDVVAEEPVEASAAAPWDGTQPLETGGGADAGDPEIEMYSEDAGQAGVDAAVDENDIEMLPDDAGQAGTDAKDGGMEEIEFTLEEAAAIPAQPDDAGDGEIEMDPEYVGRSDWHKVADKFDEKFGEDELMQQKFFRQILEDNPDLRETVKNVFGWQDVGRSDWHKVADKFDEKFGYDPGKDVEIEMPPDDVGQAGADTGVDENDIEMLPGNGEIEMLP